MVIGLRRKNRNQERAGLGWWQEDTRFWIWEAKAIVIKPCLCGGKVADDQECVRWEHPRIKWIRRRAEIACGECLVQPEAGLDGLGNRDKASEDGTSPDRSVTQVICVGVRVPAEYGNAEQDRTGRGYRGHTFPRFLSWSHYRLGRQRHRDR